MPHMIGVADWNFFQILDSRDSNQFGDVISPLPTGDKLLNAPLEIKLARRVLSPENR